MMRASTLKRHLATAGSAALAAVVLAACGGGNSTPSTGEEAPTAPGGKASGTVQISNWPLYIDEQTIPRFEGETGVEVKYVEEINDHNEFFGKVQPQFSQGDAGGRSIFIVSDWMSKKMADIGFVQKLDPDELPVVRRNLIPSLRNPSFDPDRTYTVPWQSGMTGLIVRKDLAPDINSVNDLFDPKYKGRVTMLAEMQDTVPLMVMASGVDLEDATKDDWLAAIDRIQEGVDSGQIRRFTGNDYIQDLAKGSVVAALGWSGDAVQAQADNPDIEYVQPAEGCSLWSDNMMIPVGAPNTAAAYAFMNFVYRPEVQADIVEWVNYISPVRGVKEILLERDPELANNELIFPSEEFLANCSTQDTPPGNEADQQEVEEAFQNVLTG